MKIVICGAGIAGLTLANRVSTLAGDVVLLELAPGPRSRGYVRDGKVAAFAVHRSPDPLLPDDVRAAVRDAYGGLGWVVPEALARCPPRAEVYYDQVAQIELPSWSRGGSCWSVTPATPSR